MTATRVKDGALVAGVATVTFAARYQAVEIRNKGATTSLYIRTDGTSATPGGGDDNYVCGPGERVLVPNQAMFWWQGFGAADGTKNNPGTTVSIAGSDTSQTNTFEVAGTG